MLDQIEIARVLDLLGNRNRRRIIELLREKPCFVTEISDRLMISPKAVIEHLQMLEREDILSFQTDSRRRKYYFLLNDIQIVVSLIESEKKEPGEDMLKTSSFSSMLKKFNRLAKRREDVATMLQVIDESLEDLIRNLHNSGKEIGLPDIETDIIIALAHFPLTFNEIVKILHGNSTTLLENIKRLKKDKYIYEENGRYYLGSLL